MIKRKVRKRRKYRGIMADVKTILAILVFVGVGFAVLYMTLGATSYALHVFGRNINSTVLVQGEESMNQVSAQAAAIIGVLLAIPAILAALIIVKYIAQSFGFDLSLRLYTPALFTPRKLIYRPLVRFKFVPYKGALPVVI